jgi:hypothetical protein
VSEEQEFNPERALQEGNSIDTIIRLVAGQIFNSLVSRDLVDYDAAAGSAKWTAGGRAMLNVYYPPNNVVEQPRPADYAANLAGMVIDAFGASAVSVGVEVDPDDNTNNSGHLGTAVPGQDKAGLN